MELTREQFVELVVALELRNLTLGYEAGMAMDENGQVSDEAAAAIAAFEGLQSEVYKDAEVYELGDQFVEDADSGLTVLAADSALEGEVAAAVDAMEVAVTEEMIIRAKVIELAQAKRAAAGGEITPEEEQVIIKEVATESEKYNEHIQANGYASLITTLEPQEEQVAQEEQTGQTPETEVPQPE